jgi:hypothetical protein
VFGRRRAVRSEVGGWVGGEVGSAKPRSQDAGTARAAPRPLFPRCVSAEQGRSPASAANDASRGNRRGALRPALRQRTLHTPAPVKIATPRSSTPFLSPPHNAPPKTTHTNHQHVGRKDRRGRHQGKRDCRVQQELLPV